MDVFERYAPFIQNFIYRSGWRSLRGVQNAAGNAIFGTEANVLLTASTASGKTEAAFFPILTLLDEEPSRTVGVLYIAPLKALINDQFGRLSELCEEAEIPVYRWHGDVAQSQKRKLLKKPAGILQITPESLESLLINKHMEIPSLFGDLRFIVIDEIHALIRGDRGLQTFCLIERLCRLAGCSPRRVGLSATIGNPEGAGRFMAAGSGRETIIPKFEAGKETWRLSMEHFFLTEPQAGEQPQEYAREEKTLVPDGFPSVQYGLPAQDGLSPAHCGSLKQYGFPTVQYGSPASEGFPPATYESQTSDGLPPAYRRDISDNLTDDLRESAGKASTKERETLPELAEDREARGISGIVAERKEAAEQTFDIRRKDIKANEKKQSAFANKNELSGEEPPTDKAPTGADPGLGYIFEHTRGRKCLVFTNSREECEDVCQKLRQYCEANHEPDRFLIHHGNLSASYRESAEEAMKDEDCDLSVCATATLELGIDIGRLERAFQIDAPFTVSGFLQRLGRTGRRGNPSEMWFVMREEHQEARAMLPDSIPWYLLQGIALVQLYIEERFVEPPREGRLPYSLLYHQTMSTLASGGEMTAAELASRVLTLSCFRGVTKDDYKLLLRHLLKIDHIHQTENGGLIVGITGERIVNSYKFYAVFQENIEYTVRSGSEQLGTIVKPPPVGDKIAIAGRVWVVEEVDHERREVYCNLVKGNIPAYFGDVPGDIHTRILERMYQVLFENKSYPYLMRHAVSRLADVREVFQKSGMKDRPLVHLGGKMWALFPWLGSYAFLALERFLKGRCKERLGLKGLQAARPYYMQFTMNTDDQAFYEILREEAEKGIDPMELVYPNEVPTFEKYDPYVPAELVRKGFAYGVLDMEGMRKRVLSWNRR